MNKNPGCYLYFATAGKWEGASEPRARIAAAKEALEQTELFSTVDVKPVDADMLKQTYRELQRGVTREVELAKVTTFPRIDGVDQAYIGLLPGDEFIRLIVRDDGVLNRELFYDNVRDFQGGNPVNREIDQTVSSNDKRDSFPLLNNGITVVARSIVRTGDNFRISDFQIVNGCQTTHILYANRKNITSGTYIPIKLVATHDSQVVGDVIKATNRQTAVQLEALESLTPFHRELEDFYNHRPFREEKVYYERRSKQYVLEQVNAHNVVTLTAQTKSFVGMFLNEPHSHPRYYGELLKAYERRLFVKDHRPEAYYASGVALLAVERLFRSGRIERKVRQYKYHILMLLRALLTDGDMPRLNSNAMSKYAMLVVEGLNDEVRTERCVKEAVRRIEMAKTDFRDRSARPHQLRDFTSVLRGKSTKGGGERREGGGDSEWTLGQVGEGKILWFDEWKRFGFVETERGRIFFHEGELREVPVWKRAAGTGVRFTVKRGRRGPMAGDIKTRG